MFYIDYTKEQEILSITYVCTDKYNGYSNISASSSQILTLSQNARTN